MSEGTHTPGPWRAYRHIDTNRWGVDAGPEGRLVADCGLADNLFSRDNAHLIAAAPTMLEALELHRAYEAMPTDRGGKNGPKGLARAKWLAARDAALSKARAKGGSNAR